MPLGAFVRSSAVALVSKSHRERVATGDPRGTSQCVITLVNELYETCAKINGKGTAARAGAWLGPDPVK